MNILNTPLGVRSVASAYTEEQILKDFEFRCRAIAKEFTPQGHDHDDLRQEARLAVIKGARSFAPSSPSKDFTNYATACMRNRLRDICRNPWSNADLDYGFEFDLLECHRSEQLCRVISDTIELDSALRILGDRDARLIALRFLEGRSLEECAFATQMSTEGARRAIKRALTQLNDHFNK